jgi:hypothetical protein
MPLNAREELLPQQFLACNTDSDCSFLSVGNQCDPEIVANTSKKDQVATFIDEQDFPSMGCPFGISPIRNKGQAAGCVENTCRRILIDYQSANPDQICPKVHESNGYDSEESCYQNIWRTQKEDSVELPPWKTCIKSNSGDCVAQYVIKNSKKYSCKDLNDEHSSSINQCYEAIAEHYLELGQLDIVEQYCQEADRFTNLDNTCWSTVATWYIDSERPHLAETLCTSIPTDTYARRSCMLAISSKIGNTIEVASWEVCLEVLNESCMAKYITTSPSMYSCDATLNQGYQRENEVYDRCIRAVAYSYRVQQEFDLAIATCNKMKNKKSTHFTACIDRTKEAQAEFNNTPQ